MRLHCPYSPLIGTVLTLGTPQDVTLQELRVEMFMPADEASEATLTALAGVFGGAKKRAFGLENGGHVRTPG